MLVYKYTSIEQHSRNSQVITSSRLAPRLLIFQPRGILQTIAKPIEEARVVLETSKACLGDLSRASQRCLTMLKLCFWKHSQLFPSSTPLAEQLDGSAGLTQRL